MPNQVTNNNTEGKAAALPPTNSVPVIPPVLNLRPGSKEAVVALRAQLGAPGVEDPVQIQKNCKELNLDPDRTSRFDLTAKRLGLDPKKATEGEIFSALLGQPVGSISTAKMTEAFGLRSKETIYQYAANSADLVKTKEALAGIYKAYLTPIPNESLPLPQPIKGSKFNAACRLLETDSNRTSAVGLAAKYLHVDAVTLTTENLTNRFGANWKENLIKKVNSGR